MSQSEQPVKRKLPTLSTRRVVVTYTLPPDAEAKAEQARDILRRAHREIRAHG